MLTTSPVAPRAMNGSPRTFHYSTNATTHSAHSAHSAHAHSVHSPDPRSPKSGPKSPRVVAPLARRQSRQSSSSFPHPSPPQHSITTSAPSTGPSTAFEARSSPLSQPKPPKQYVGVDVATQYSPMEPFDPTVPLRSVHPSEACPRKPRPANITTTASATVIPSAPPSAVPDPPPEPRISPEKPDDPRTNPLSPGKRRKSHDLATAQPSSSVVAASQPSSPKRSKPNKGPPKVLPLAYELCGVDDMVVLIANMLGELIETNDSIAMKSGQLTRFHSRTAPGISVLDYLHRLAKHATLTPPLLLSMVYYIDRLCALYPDFTINTLTVHRFLITAAAVAGKGLSDSFWNNSFYARVGGVKVAELKLLELEFLYRVDWRIVPNPEVLVAYYKGLVERCDGYALEGDEASASASEGFEGIDSDGIYEDGSDTSAKAGAGETNGAPGSQT